MWGHELPLSLILLIIPVLFVLPVFYFRVSVYRRSHIPKSWEKPFQDIKVLTPYLRPQGQAELRNTLGLLAAAFLCTGVVRAINVVGPLLLRRILDRLSGLDRQQERFPW